MAKHKIEVQAGAVRNPKTETAHYTIPDPKNWDEFYAHANNQEIIGSTDPGALKRFMATPPPLQTKCIAIEKGGAPVVLEVSDHYYNMIRQDRNVFIRDLGLVEEKPQAAAVASAPPADVSSKKKRRGRPAGSKNRRVKPLKAPPAREAAPA